ncbi:DUF4126 domain-containing protein [bacterium]|nr:DUF4126 domain-containing protein [bacterium]
MDTLSTLPVLLGSSWASGVNLYLTAAALGIAHRLDWVQLPGNMETLANPLIILLALVLYAVEFFADKIPYIDSIWDTVHTIIRPMGGMALGYMAMSDMSPAIQIPAALLTGSIALDSHLTKATTRIAVNASPEPVSNSVISIGEDLTVMGALYLLVKHPVVISILVLLFILFSIWFFKKMFKFVKLVFSKKKKPEGLPAKP